MTATTATAFEEIRRLGTRGASQSMGELREILSSLVQERQELRLAHVRLTDLEDNRLAIVECQWALSRALLAAFASRELSV